MKTQTPESYAITPSRKELATAIVESIQFWTNPICNVLLLSTSDSKQIDKDWFSRFTVEWRVRRTLDANEQCSLLRYLNGEDFRNAIAESDPSGAVDLVAEHIQSQGWSAKRKTNNIRVKPTSLVSKIAFLMRPNELPPMDRFSKLGLNRIRGAKKDGGEGHLHFPTYAEYLREFNVKYGGYQALLRAQSQTSWTKPLAEALGCEPAIVKSDAFTRKAFDNLLMQIGRRKDPQ